MKQLVICILLLAVIGFAGFLYRNSLEQRGPASFNAAPTACTEEAMLCPDGSSVGRTGPSCTFAACPVTRTSAASLGVTYAVPAGFTAAPLDGIDPTIAAVYVAGTSTPTDAIVVRRYPILAGKTAVDVLLEETMYESSGNKPEAISEFTPVTIGGKEYRSITVERFEAIVHTHYYLLRGTDVLRFEALDYDVMDWTDPNLDITTLPAHAALLQLLSTLQ